MLINNDAAMPNARIDPSSVTPVTMMSFLRMFRAHIAGTSSQRANQPRRHRDTEDFSVSLCLCGTLPLCSPLPLCRLHLGVRYSQSRCRALGCDRGGYRVNQARIPAPTGENCKTPGVVRRLTNRG